MAVIEGKVYEQRKFFDSALNPESNNTEALTASLEEMKGHFSKWEQLYKTKNKVMKDVFAAVRSKESLSKEIERDLTSDSLPSHP